MAYLLILPLGIYIALAIAILDRRPRGIANFVLALYMLSAAAGTAAYLILGTTNDRAAAEVVHVAAALMTSWSYLLFLPFVLLGLWFESWTRLWWRRVLAGGIALVVVVDAIVVFVMLGAGRPLVYPASTGFIPHWVFSYDIPYTPAWLTWSFFILISQTLLVCVIGLAVRHRRLEVWNSGVPFTLASLLTVATPFVGPLAGARGIVLVYGLRYIPAVVVLVIWMRQAAKRLPPDHVIQEVLGEFDEPAMLIDANRRVIWKNALWLRWLAGPPLSGVAEPHLFEMLRGSSLADVIPAWLDTEDSSTEVEFSWQESDYVLRLDRLPVKHVSFLPAVQLITLRDITAEHNRRDLEARRQELLSLSAISAEIASSLDVDQVVARALQQVADTLQSDAVVAFLVDSQDTSQLRLAGALYADGQSYSAPAWLKIEQTVAGEALVSQKTVLISDALEEPARATLMTRRGFRAGATIPLITRERVIGVLQIGYTGPRRFDAVEVALLESVGRQMAVSIENARLHAVEREQRHIAETLRSVASLLSNKPLDEALAAMLAELKKIIDYDRATVLLLAQPGTLRIGAQAGFTGEPVADEVARVRIEIAQFPYLLTIFDEGQPQIVADTTADERWVYGQYPYGSWMGIPLRTRDQVLGCLSVMHQTPRHFSAADLRMGITFADQAVIAVQNARLFESEQQRRLQAEFLQRASYDLVSSPTLKAALLSALTNLAEVMTFDRAHIALIDRTGQTWYSPATYPQDRPVSTERIKRMNSYPLIKAIMENRRPILIPDTRIDDRWLPGNYGSREVRCWIGAPLVVRDDVVGVLNVDGFTPGGFDEENRQIAQVFANQIGAAVENFRLLEETNRQNRALRALNTVITASTEAMTHDNLLMVSLQRVLGTLDLTGGMIHQCDESGEELRLRAHFGLPDEVHAALNRVPFGDRLPPVTLNSGEVYAFFSVPLTAHGSCTGLLSVLQQESLNADLQALLGHIAHHLGVVMDNANLFEDTTRRGILSTDLSRLSLAISAQLDRENVLDLICRESIGIFDVQGAYIWLIEGDRLVGAAAYGPGARRFSGHTIHLEDTTLLPARVIDEWRPRFVNYVEQSPALPADFMDLVQAQSVLAIPLLKADVPLGTLLLVNMRDSEAFADWMAEHTGMLGVQAALAIQNASLFDEVRRRLEHLRLVNDVSRHATAILSVNSLIEGVAHRLFDTLNYDVIALLQIQNDFLGVSAVYVRRESVAVEGFEERYTASNSAPSRSIRLAEPVVCNTACPLDVESVGEGAQTDCCVLAVPMLLADEVIGVLVVERRGRDSILREDLDVLEPLAAQLAISVSSARLFETIRQQAIELEARVEARTDDIQREKERTELILRSVADAVIVFDVMGNVVMTNPAAKRLFDQYDLDHDLGARVRTLMSELLDPKMGHADPTEVVELGSVTLQARASRMVEGNDVLGSVVVLRDVTRQRELDRLKDQFVSTVSHELRTPLANLKLYLSLLQQGRPERRQNYLNVMSREAERLARLIDDLLQLSRLQGQRAEAQPAVHEPIDVAELVSSVIEGNQAWAESEGKTLTAEGLESPLPIILGDRSQLVRALTNLVSNSLSYTPETGAITVRARTEPVEHTTPEWVIIEVIDNGIGIPSQELSVVFERFYRGSNVDPNIPGTGLGLAIIKDIVTLHGGMIEVESTEGHGSTFRLTLPTMVALEQ